MCRLRKVRRRHTKEVERLTREEVRLKAKCEDLQRQIDVVKDPADLDAISAEQQILRRDLEALQTELGLIKFWPKGEG